MIMMMMIMIMIMNKTAHQEIDNLKDQEQLDCFRHRTSSSIFNHETAVLVFESSISARQIQFLSHQSRIASKIELYVDDKTDEKTDFLIRKFYKDEDTETKGTNF